MSIPATIPVIDTDDLILRGYREADFDAFATFSASDRSCYAGGPQGRWESWKSFMAAIGHWSLRGYGMWIAEHRESGAVAGRAGLIRNDGWHEPELAWHLFDGFEGRGLAYQAGLAARAYAANAWGAGRGDVLYRCGEYPLRTAGRTAGRPVRARCRGAGPALPALASSDGGRPHMIAPRDFAHRRFPAAAARSEDTALFKMTSKG